MPGRIIDHHDDFGVLTDRIGARDILEVRCKGHLQALLFAVPGLCFAPRRLLVQASRETPWHHIAGSKTIDLLLILPRPHRRAIALPPQRGPSRRPPRKGRPVLAQEPAGPALRFFFTASRSA